MSSSEYVSIREEVLSLLSSHYPEMCERFGIESVALFGSVSRGEDTAESDVDVLYTFQEGKATYRNLSGLSLYLEKLLGRKTDLVSRKWIDEGLLSVIRDDIIPCSPAALGAA